MWAFVGMSLLKESIPQCLPFRDVCVNAHRDRKSAICSRVLRRGAFETDDGKGVAQRRCIGAPLLVVGDRTHQHGSTLLALEFPGTHGDTASSNLDHGVRGGFEVQPPRWRSFLAKIRSQDHESIAIWHIEKWDAVYSIRASTCGLKYEAAEARGHVLGSSASPQDKPPVCSGEHHVVTPATNH